MLFRMLCAILLVFTTIAPSIALANTSAYFSIIIHPGSADRVIGQASVYTQSQGNYDNLVGSRLDDGSYRFEGKMPNNSSQGIASLIAVQYTENGQSFYFFEEYMMNEGENQYTIQNTGDILKTDFSSELSDSSFTHHINIGSDNEWRWITFAIQNDTTIVSTSAIKGNVSLRGEMDNKLHLLRTPFTIGSSINLNELLPNTSEIEIHADVANLNFHEVNDKGSFHVENFSGQSLIISKGKYNVSYTNGGNNWYGLADFEESQLLNLPTEPEKLTIESTHQYSVENNEVNLNYNVKLSAESFTIDSMQNKQIHYSISNGTEIVSEWTDSHLYGVKTFENTIQSGLYTLNASLTIDGQEFNAEKELIINSPINQLKGTVITAESTDGQTLQSGIVTIYELKKHGEYTATQPEKSVSIQMDNGKYEAFIPDAYILDGKEYLLTVINESEKVAYAKRFIGQSEKNLHLSANTLIQPQFITGSYETEKVDYSLISEKGYPLFRMNLDGLGWRLSVDAEVNVTWIGKDEEGHGYVWNRLVNIAAAPVIDVTVGEASIYSPSATYTNAYFKMDDLDTSFKSIKMINDGFYEIGRLQLVADDDQFVYKAYVQLYNQPNIAEIQFPSFYGQAYLKDANQLIGVHYYGEGFNELQIESKSTVQQTIFTYEIYDDKKQLIETIDTHKIDSFKLKQPLQNGTYTIKLAKTNFRDDIVSLNLESEITVSGSALQTPGQTQLERLFVDNQTTYGEYHKEEIRIQVTPKPVNNNYSQKFSYYWRGEGQQYTPYEAILINPSSEYDVTLTFENHQSGKVVIDEQRMTGAQLLDVSKENPLQATEGLSKLQVNTTENYMDLAFIELELQKVGFRGSEVHARFWNNTDIQIYLPSFKYLGALTVQDKQDNLRITPISEFTMDQDRIVTVNPTDFTKFTFGSKTSDLSIYGYETFKNYLFYFDVPKHINSIAYPKNMTGDLQFYIASREKNATPWGYQVKAEKLTTVDNQHYNFNIGDINGSVTDLHVTKESFNSRVDFDFAMTVDGLAIQSVYRAVESNHRPSLLSVEDPIRDYTGLFQQWNRVDAIYSLIDSKGKAVWEQSDVYYGENNRSVYIPSSIKSGTYDFQIQIPISSGKSITMKKPITIVGEGVQFVQLTSPKEGAALNEDPVEITGLTNSNEEVLLEINQNGIVIDSSTVTSNRQGIFNTSFKLEEGTYTVIATVDDSKAETTFTVDRTPPEAVKDLTIIKEGANLIANWSASEDATAYTVEMAKNEEDFVILSDKQPDISAIIRDVELNTTYRVRVTAYDAAGNTSLSDIKSYVVSEFDVTSISIKDDRGSNGLLTIGQQLLVQLKGSPGEGYEGKASVRIDGITKDIVLTYNEATANYEGQLLVEKGMKKIESVSGFIQKESKKTDTVTQEVNWSVGSTLKGLVSDGDLVEHAIVRLISSKTYTASTNAQGEFTIEGLPAGNYKITVSLGSKTFAGDSITIGESDVQQMKSIEIPALTNAIVKLMDNSTDIAVKDGLSLRLTGPQGYAVYGTSVNGMFKTFEGNTQLFNLQTGDYTLTVYGQGAYQQTTATIQLEKGKTEYLVAVNKLVIEEKDITITLPSDVKSVDSIWLQSYKTYSQYQYSGVGSYYQYNVKPDSNGNIVIKNVALADDYELHIEVDGYMSHVQTINLKETQEVSVDLEKGRVISGTVVDAQNKPLQNIDVYAYDANSSRSAKTDAEGKFELIGLSKTAPIQLNAYSQIYLGHSESIDKGQENQLLTIQMARSASITGKVVDRNNNPLQNVSISAMGDSSYGWARSARDGSFTINGLVDTKEYNLELQLFGYPSISLKEKKAGDIGQIILQAEGDGEFSGTGNYLATAKSSVVPSDEVQFTLSYKNNGLVDATQVPVTIKLPEGISLIEKSTTLNGKGIAISDNVLTIPSVKVGESGKISFTGKVSPDIKEPSLTTTAKITNEGTIMSVTNSVVFVTLDVPAQTGATELKVYGNAKYGSTVDVYANDKLVGQTKVEGKWWFMDVKLPVTDSTKTETFSLTAKVTDNGISAFAKPVDVSYVPDVPTIKDVTVHAGWNGDVKLNPYTGIATFAISENTPLHTTVVFDKAVDSATINFLGKTYNLVKGKDNTFTFDGHKLGRWTSFGEQLLEVTFKKGDVEITLPLMNIIVLIDPSGYVFEGSMDNRLEGVQAVVETKVGENWVQWDAVKFGQVNPQVTDEEGRYGWDVITGEWRVIFTKDGYEPYISRVMNVPPPETELDIPMIKVSDPGITTTVVTEKDLTVSFDRLMKAEDMIIQLIDVATDFPVEGEIQSNQLPAYQSIDTPADKSAGFLENDSRGEAGFFSIDTEKNVAQTFTFIPSEKLEAETTYQLVVSGEVEDYAGKLLGESAVFEFTTSKEDNSNGGSGGTPGNGGSTETPGTGGNNGMPDGDNSNGGNPEKPINPGNGGGTSSNKPETDKPEIPSTSDSEVGKETIDNSTGVKTIFVNSTYVEKQITDSKLKEIVIPLSKDATINKVSASFDKALWKQIQDSKKPIKLVEANSTILIPAESIQDMLLNNGDSIVISTAVVNDVTLPKISGNQEVRSSVFDFTIEVVNGNQKRSITTFKKPVIVSLKVNNVKNAAKVSAFYLNEQQKLDYVGGKLSSDTFTFKTSHFSKYVVLENDKSFTDIHNAKVGWAAEYIEVLASKNIIQGKTENTFGPSDAITRAQFAALLSRSLNLPKQSYTGTFADVSEKNGAALDIEAANRVGIVGGENGKFRPNEKITRQQMAAMIIRAVEYQNPALLNGVDDTVTFKDASSISDYAKKYVGLSAALGIINGREEKGEFYFAPKENATRAHAAKMLYQFMELE